MSKFVRYTCNKKNEPVLREDCKGCPEYNPCAKDGKWCFVGALVAEGEKMIADGIMPNTESLVSPNLRDMTTYTIHLGDNQSVDVLREDIKKHLQKGLLKHWLS